MTALGTCGGSDIVRGRIHLPQRGVWWADLKLDTQNPPSGKVTIAFAGGLSIAGTVASGGTFLDSTHIRIFGGGANSSLILAPQAYRNCLVRDPMSAIFSATGDSASSTVDPAITSALLPAWGLAAETAARALDNLVGGVGRLLSQKLNWRILSDGTTWFGQDTYPQVNLPTSSDVLWITPVGPRYEIGCATPTLLPGVFLNDVGQQITGVDHWIEPDRIRTWAWT